MIIVVFPDNGFVWFLKHTPPSHLPEKNGKAGSFVRPAEDLRGGLIVQGLPR
jgi:hypothetical protein